MIEHSALQGIRLRIPACCSTRAGFPPLKQEPMTNTVLSGQESSGQLAEEISQLENIALGEGAVVCLVCGFELREGTPVMVYAFRPAGEITYQIGHVTCAENCRMPMECFTLGVRELVVEGRVGWCSDQATQSSWPVLLAPVPLTVSPAAATTAVLRFDEIDSGRLPKDCKESQPVVMVRGDAGVEGSGGEC